MKSSKKKASTQSLKKTVKPPTNFKIKLVGNSTTSKKLKPKKSILLKGKNKIKGNVESITNPPIYVEPKITPNKTVETFEAHHKKIVFPKSKIKTQTQEIIESHNIYISELPQDIFDGIYDLISFINKNGKTKKYKNDLKEKDTATRKQLYDWFQAEVQKQLDKGKKEAVPLEEKYATDTIKNNFNETFACEDIKRNESLNYETSQKARNEAIKAFKSSNIIKKDKTLPEYILHCENPTNKPLTCVLFGSYSNLMKTNHGSDKGIIVKPSKNNAQYLQALTNSEQNPCKIKNIKIISENFTQLLQDILVTGADANGEYEEKPLVTKKYVTNDTKRVLTIEKELIINGYTALSFTLLPKTHVSILFYDENIPVEEKAPVKVVSVTDMIILYNAIISCQIQQGLNFVSLKDVDKFTGSKAGASIPVLDKIVEAGFVKTKQVNGEKQLGINLKMLTISGKTHTVNIKTAMQKSEYKLKK